MTVIYIILGTILTVLFFLHIKSAADLLCRIVGGFAFLIIYNSVAPLISLPALGINLVSATLCGILGLPGGAALILLNLFL